MVSPGLLFTRLVSRPSHYWLDFTCKSANANATVSTWMVLQISTKPYTVPYGVIVPQRMDGLLIHPRVGTHIGFSTLRMEPCWMALGKRQNGCKSQH